MTTPRQRAEQCVKDWQHPLRVGDDWNNLTTAIERAITSAVEEERAKVCAWLKQKTSDSSDLASELAEQEPNAASEYATTAEILAIIADAIASLLADEQEASDG